MPYLGSDAGDLNVGGKLNKLAANVALGRNTRCSLAIRRDGIVKLESIGN